MLARLGRVVGVLVALALLAQPLPALADVGSKSGWREAVRALASADYGLNSQASIVLAQERLSPGLAGGLGKRRLSAVVADTPAAYFDDVRFNGLTSGRSALRHQRQLVAFLQSRLANRPHDAALSEGLVAVMAAGRLCADAAIQDAAATVQVRTDPRRPGKARTTPGRAKPGSTPGGGKPGRSGPSPGGDKPGKSATIPENGKPESTSVGGPRSPGGPASPRAHPVTAAPRAHPVAAA